MAHSLDGSVRGRIPEETRAPGALLARLIAAWRARRTRATLRRLDADQLKDIGLAPGDPRRDRWM